MNGEMTMKKSMYAIFGLALIINMGATICAVKSYSKLSKCIAGIECADLRYKIAKINKALNDRKK